MLPHHQKAIDRLTEHFQNDERFLALIVGGSLVKGFARPDSDVDFMLVATDEEYARRLPKNDLCYFTTDFCDYPGGYVDGKIVDVPFLREVAERGSEPARAAFVGAYLTFTRLPDLPDLLARIPVYQENEQRRKLESFGAQVLALQWYIGEAEKHQNAYLMTHVVADLVLFGGRMILAHNKILYPYHKWFLAVLNRAPQKPENLMELIQTLLAQPSKVNADRFCEAILTFTEWPQPAESWPARFMHDSEWNWRYGPTPLADS
jgi:hypothetical protein